MTETDSKKKTEEVTLGGLKAELAKAKRERAKWIDMFDRARHPFADWLTAYELETERLVGSLEGIEKKDLEATQAAIKVRRAAALALRINSDGTKVKEAERRLDFFKKKYPLEADADKKREEKIRKSAPKPSGGRRGFIQERQR